MSQETSATVIDLAALRVACKDCSLHQLCLPIGIAESDLAELEKIIQRRRIKGQGKTLFRTGDPFSSIFAVRSGSIKTFLFTEDGREQITGFYLPGELFGLEGINTGTHCCTATTLEDSSVCEIPFDRLESLAPHVPGLLSQMVRLMSKEIRRDRAMMHLARKTADERLAGFLLGLSMRFRERGFSDREFRLSMSRSDIGNYLGLAIETVSRLFTRFQHDGLLMVKGKQVQLLDLDRLRTLANEPGCRVASAGR
jgi:CRP/FNR family transcriptional regulator